jgi:hypothetical protein
MTFNFIRIDRSLTVPATSVFMESLDGERILVHVPGFAKPFTVGGEMATALRAYLEGAKQFPITVNGILDIYAGWVQGLEAQKAFNAPMEKALGNWPLEHTHFIPEKDFGGSPVEPIYQRSPVPPSAVPQVNVQEVARRIKERK